MKNSSFQFKQFAVQQDKCAMKISTDGVVLGAYAGQGNPKKILDIGAGTGVISLMLAQRFPEAMITGIEIDKDASEQASENVRNSPWNNRISILNKSFQEFCKHHQDKFDLIVSNPPYFPNHLKTEDHQRNLALHNDTLPFEELMAGIKSIMDQEATSWLILPPYQMEETNKIAEVLGLFAFEKLKIQDKPSKNFIRVIQGFSLQKKELIINSLSIKDEEGNYSKEYSDLLKNFLLIF
jgi:tRNA1Val (adenine37-N6)-methyltransferase